MQLKQNGQVVFLHKIKEGPTDKSYGIHVAKLAELPDSLIARAKEVLAQLEGQEEIIIPKRVEVKVHRSYSRTSSCKRRASRSTRGESRD